MLVSGFSIPGERNGASVRPAGRLQPRIYRRAARLSSALLCVALLATGAAAQTVVVVPEDWSLTPSGLSAGDQFRLMFITSNMRDATSTYIAHYNLFVQTRAKLGHTLIRSYRSQFRALGSTATVDARDNTSTTGAGVPIYWLGGAKVADNYADFYDGSWASSAGRNEFGGTVSSSTQVWSGSAADGTKAVHTINPRALGAPNFVAFGRGSALFSSQASPSDLKSLYGLSPVFEVGQPPQLSISAPADANEGNLEDGHDPVTRDPALTPVTRDLTFTVTLGTAISRSVAFEVCFTGTAQIKSTLVGGEVAFSDYQPLLSGSPRISNCLLAYVLGGSTSSTAVGIRVKGDTKFEPDETVVATLKFRGTPPPGVTLGTRIATHTILNDDNAPPSAGTVRITGGDPITEGGSAVFTVTADPAPTARLEVRLATLDATESPISDFLWPRNEGFTSVWIEPGNAAATFTLPTVDDTKDEPNGTVSARILVPGYGWSVGTVFYRLHGPTQARVTVRDDDLAPMHSPPDGQLSTVTISADRTSVTEGGDVTFTVTADPAPAGDLEVTVSADEEMGSGDDLVRSGHFGRVTIWAGVTSATWTVETWSDDDDLADGTVVGRIEAGDGYTVGDPFSVTVALLDDDEPTTQSVPEDSVVGDPATPGVDPALVAQVRGYAAETHEGQAHVDRWKRVLAAFGDDNGHTAMTAAEAQTHADRGWQRWVPVVAALEALEAAPEPPQQPLTLPAVSVSAGVDVTEGGDAMFTLTANPAPAADLAVSVDIAADGAYGIAAGRQTVTIPTTGSATLTLATANDDADEPDGSVTATLNDGDGYTVGDPATAAVSVADDDEPTPAVTISAGDAVAEGGAAAFTLTASPAPAADLAVTVTVATEGDFGVAAGSRTVTVPTAGSATLTLATVDDDADEPDGSVSVTVAAGDGYAAGDPATAAVAVTDDDEPRLPALSVADVEVEESGGAFMTFAVRLSAPAADTVTVRAATRDSTPASATAGKDYWPVDAELRFRAGETERRVGVVVFDDDHDEGSETFELALSDARGAAIGDGVAVGTIANDDPLPAAWLARFGRGVAERALEGVSERLDAPRGERGLRGTVAGVPLGFGVPGGAARPAPGPAPGEYGGGAAAPAAGDGAAGLGGGASFPSGSGLGPLSGSRLSWGGAEDAGGGTLGLWGRASRSRFDGREGALALDGETATTLLGADYARGRWLAGVALARSRGEGAYRAAGAAAGDCGGGDAERGACMAAAGGEVSSSLTAAIPYASLRASGRLRLWGAAGAGAGEVSLATAAGGVHAAATSWRMAAAGLRGDLLGGGAGPALAVVSDALWTRAASAAARGLAASDSGASRLRLGLEGRWELPVPGGGRLTPSLEAGARRDGGDAETGLGVELGGGLAWRQPSLGIALDLSGRTLVSHEDGAAAERGLSASLAYDPTPASARGLSLSLRQHRGGQAAGGLDALFAGDPLARRLEGGRDADAGRWTMEAGWGVAAFGGRFVGTPHVGVSASAFGRDLSVGWRLAPEAAAAPGPSLGVEAARREGGAAGAEHGVRIEVSAQW